MLTSSYEVYVREFLNFLNTLSFAKLLKYSCYDFTGSFLHLPFFFRTEKENLTVQNFVTAAKESVNVRVMVNSSQMEMKNSSPMSGASPTNLSQSMDSVNTAVGEDEVSLQCGRFFSRHLPPIEFGL